MHPKIKILHGLALVMIVFFSASLNGQVATSPRAPLAPLPYIPLPAGTEVEFSSEDSDLVGRVAQYIKLAKSEVLISQYAITDERVIQAICAAFQQGVVVGVLADRSPAIKNYDTLRYLRSQGVPVILASRGLTGAGWHNQRYVVIDRECVVLTTCDMTKSARKNTENLIALRLPAIAVRFYNNWLSEAQNGQPLP